MAGSPQTRLDWTLSKGRAGLDPKAALAARSCNRYPDWVSRRLLRFMC